MAGIPFPRLLDRFIADLERQGASVLLEAPVVARPARLRVDGRRYIVFLWTITPGGGPTGTRPPNERRIQITNIAGLPLEPDARTVLGGWSDECSVYSFWDARRHVTCSRRSPSLQVDRRTLVRASSAGLATQSRPTLQGFEMVLAVAPNALLWYLQTGYVAHNAPEDANEVDRLLSATPEEERAFLDDDPAEVTVAQRYDLVQVIRAFRAASFRPAVLGAYAYRCAVCGIALKLVDAAHIVPVAYPGSTDEVTNGIALCKLHHAAYDNAIIGVRPDYAVAIHPQAKARLQAVRLSGAQLDAGFDEFTSALPPRIRLPNRTDDHPSPDNLRIGLHARGWI